MLKEEYDLSRFITDEKLELLEKSIQIFNPIKVLGVQYHEIRHSNILAWLLSPNEIHNLRDYFIKKIISEAILRNDQVDIDFPSVLEIYKGNFCDTEVRREWENIDVILISRSNKIVVIIENKINSNERKGQLAKYYYTVKSYFPEFQILPIYLTLSEDEPGNSNYLILGHKTIYNIVKSALELHQESINSKVVDFIEYYLGILEELTMANDQLIDLCKTVYSQHKEAIDLIVQYAVQTNFTLACNKFAEAHKDELTSVHTNSSLFIFIPKEFEGVVPDTNVYTKDKYLVIYWFVKNDDKLKLILEVGEFPDGNKRNEFMKLLSNNNIFKIPQKAIDGQSKTTRIYSQTVKEIDWEDMPTIVKKMEELYFHKFEKANKSIVKLINEFNWKGI